MSEPVWGQLPKALDDPQLITEAISAGIAAHEADPEAHLGVGEALTSHRAAEIIDHLAESIVTDKILARAVTVEKLNVDKQLVMPHFESLDGWYQSKTGTGANIELGGGSAKLTAGQTSGNKTLLALTPFTKYLDSSKDPWFQVSVAWDPAEGICDAIACVGEADPWGSASSFGFLAQNSDNKLYAYYKHDSTFHKIEVSGVNPWGVHTLRAAMSADGDTIHFYRDDVLVATASGAAMTLDNDIYLSFAVKNIGGDSDGAAIVWDPIFSQNW